MFKIGEFAKLNRVTIATLRHYDVLNLLKPVKTDELTGYRYYSAEQMTILNRILNLKDMGFSLEEILLIVKENKGKETLKELLAFKQSQIQDNIDREQERLNLLKGYMEYLDQEGTTMEYDVIFKKTEEIKVAGLRDIIPDYPEQGHLWEELVSYIESNKGKIIPPCLVIYYDNKELENAVDAEVLEAITGELKGSDRVNVRKLESVPAACVIHKGPYKTIGQAYKAASSWIEENGYTINGPQRELYLKGEWNSESEEEYITEIQLPVEKKISN